MRSVLVTGGAGYIGAHICRRLAADGVLPVTLDNLSTGDRRWVKWGHLVKGDIADRAVLQSIRSRHEIAAVIHAAALLDVAESVREPQLYWLNNVGGTAALMDVFGDLPCVLSSSAAIYGTVEDFAVEDRKPSPESPYGETKLECERLLPSSMRLRYFNVSGCDPEIGFRENGTHLIANVLRCAKSGDVLEIQGDGSAVRDFVDARDVANANVLALRALLAGVEGCCMNVCVGLGHSVEDVVRAAAKVTGRRIKTTRTARRAGDLDRMVGNNHLAAATIGWKPHYPLQEQIASAWFAMMRTGG